MKFKTSIFLSLLSVALLFSFRQQQTPPNALGLVASLDKDNEVYAAGFKMIGEAVSRTLSPSFTEDQFKHNIERIKKAKCRVYMCNILFPSAMKIAGPQVNEPVVLAYADSVFLRAKQAGIGHIILGSGGSRRLPEGYDAKKAQADFTVLCSKLALLAQKHHIILVLESLETAETNFLLTLTETAQVVRTVNNPNFRLNADIYHMGRMKESPQSIIDNADLLVHCEIAEFQTRSLPGMKGDDFKPYLRALRKANYKGPIFIEPSALYTAADAAMSFKYLTKQLAEVYAE
jgi:sugar phosphate isomerase/epimerase